MERIPARFFAPLLKFDKVEALSFFVTFKLRNTFKYTYPKVLIGFMMLNFLFGSVMNLNAQSPSPSAMFEVASDNRGMIFPRVSLTSTNDVTTINAPAVSLMVYNPNNAGTYPYNVVPGFYYWNGVRWTPMNGPMAFSEFYALMPPDNTATIAAGTAINFPQNGRTNGVIIRSSANQFLLPDVGTYQVNWQVSINEAAQLGLQLNGTLITNTVVGRATGTSQIVGNTIIITTIPNSILSVLNPAGNTPAITITPTAGGTNAVTANLIITRIQ